MPNGTLRRVETDRRQKECVESIRIPVLIPLNAKEHEQYSPGRSPGYWLQRISYRLPIPSETVAFPQKSGR